MVKTRTIENTKYFSKKIGTLPKGCKQCVQGKKTVLFITGLCPRSCEYCPVSDTKMQHDVIYANERPITNSKEFLEESKTCSSQGAGITGGDPLVSLKRTVEYIKKAKEQNPKYHLHLYTSMNLVTEKTLKQLYDAGLDEIRFHLDLDDDSLWNKLSLAKNFSWDTGVEIPVIPNKEKQTKKLIDFVEDKVSFLNLNELELADSNANILAKRGFKSKDKVSYAVKGSAELAERLLNYCLNKKLNVHYCSAKLKDKIQLVRRIKRRAKNISKEYDMITHDGTLVRGVIYTKHCFPEGNYTKVLENLKSEERKELVSQLKRFRLKLLHKYGIPPELIGIDKEKARLLTTGGVIEELTQEIKSKGFLPGIIEEFPTWDGFIVDLALL